MAEIIDYKKLAKERLATQFKESTNLITYMNLLIEPFQEIQEVLCDVIDSRWLNTAEGKQLDVIGDIVGQPRVFIDSEIFEYFGFDNHAQAQSFGTISDATVGGRFVSQDEPITGFRELNDDEYRLFIKARIVRNSTSSTPEEIISHLKYLFDAPQVIYTETTTAYQISVGRKLSLNEKSIITDTDILPKTTGVSVDYISEYDGNNFFSFIQVPNAEGFGTVSNSNVGGQFGNLMF